VQAFTGEYRHTMDTKGRLAVPSKFRAQLSGGAVVTGWLDNCLAIWTKERFDVFMARIQELPVVSDPHARAFVRWFTTSVNEIEFDGQGRFVVPPTLRTRAGLDSAVVVAGVGSRIEVWSADRYDSYQEELATPEVIAANLSGLGI
jgi:MraZ protein